MAEPEEDLAAYKMAIHIVTWLGIAFWLGVGFGYLLWGSG